MAQTAREGTARVRRAAVPVLPEELVVWEILVRVPAKTLLRCRAVCRSFRRLTSAADFLLAHHRHQPPLPLLSFRSGNKHAAERDDTAFDAFDLRRSPAERRPVLRFNGYLNNRPHLFRVHASCDGLIVVSLSKKHNYYICNPTTRQWISLPNLAYTSVFGLYPHSSNGEYRVLYWNGNPNDRNTLCYVLTMGSSITSRGIGNYQASGLQFVMERPSVLVHGCLHWVHSGGGRVLVFDTNGESFRWMKSPTIDNDRYEPDLVQVDTTLGFSCLNNRRTMMKLWILQDSEQEIWSLKYQIKLPIAEITSIIGSLNLYRPVLFENGDVLVLCLRLDRKSCLIHSDREGKLVKKFQWDDVFSWPTQHWFKESLVQHAFFQKQSKDLIRTPRFFQGL